MRAAGPEDDDGLPIAASSDAPPPLAHAMLFGYKEIPRSLAAHHGATLVITATECAAAWFHWYD